jgi:hypothetical protein
VIACNHSAGPSPCASSTAALPCALAAGAWLDVDGPPYDADANASPWLKAQRARPASERQAEALALHPVGARAADPSVVGCCPRAIAAPTNASTQRIEETFCDVHGRRERGRL